MRKFKVFVLFLAVAALSLSACKKEDEDDNGGNNGSSGTMTLKADGADFSADLAVQAVNSNGVINVTGSDGNARQCSLILYGASGTGTYDIGATNPQNVFTWTEGTGQLDSYVASFVIGSGSVTITELTDTKIKGTFSFTGFNNNQESRTITDGQFEANFN